MDSCHLNIHDWVEIDTHLDRPLFKYEAFWRKLFSPEEKIRIQRCRRCGKIVKEVLVRF